MSINLKLFFNLLEHQGLSYAYHHFFYSFAVELSTLLIDGGFYIMDNRAALSLQPKNPTVLQKNSKQQRIEIWRAVMTNKPSWTNKQTKTGPCLHAAFLLSFTPSFAYNHGY